MHGGELRAIAVLATALALSPLTTTPAAAQQGLEMQGEPTRGETVTERPRPEYDAQGLRVGGFELFPSLTVSERFDDNIFRSSSDRDADLITEVSPRANLASDWNNHRLGFSAGADIGFFAFNPDENYQDYFAGIDGRLDVRRNSFFFGDATYSRLHEDRGSPDDVGGEEPTEYDLFETGAGYFHRFNRLSIRPDVEFRRYDFHDVQSRVGGLPGEINNDDRDRKQVRAGGRVGYQFMPDYEAFVDGHYNVVRYDSSVDDLGFNRDSQGFDVVGGLSVDLTGVLFANVFAGYRSQSFDDPRFSTVSGPSFGGELIWNPTGLTTVTAGIERTIRESTVNGASGAFATVFRARVDHELLRNVILSGNAGYEDNDFRGINRNDDIVSAGAGVRYLMNRYVHLGLNYGYRLRNSNVEGSDYVNNRVTLSVRAQF